MTNHNAVPYDVHRSSADLSGLTFEQLTEQQGRYAGRVAGDMAVAQASYGTAPNKYDHLFEPVVERPDGAAVVARAEAFAEPTPRDLAVFAPKVQEDTPAAHPGFDHLFADTDEDYLAGSAEPTPPKKPEWKVTEGTRADAAATLRAAMQRDDSLAAVITQTQAIPQEGTPQHRLLGMVDALRSDPNVRIPVARYLQGKLEAVIAQAPGGVPSRVLRNGRKSPPREAERYPANLTSREYVILLSLAQLDGTFDREAARSAGLTAEQRDGSIELGQHRAVASALLNDFGATADGEYADWGTQSRPGV